MTRRSRLLTLRLALAICCAAAGGAMLHCGTGEDILGGSTGWGFTGVSPWSKVDLDPNTEGGQIFVALAPPEEDFAEPMFVKAEGAYWIFYERRQMVEEDGERRATSSDIVAIRATDAFTYEPVNDGEPVLIADRPWEDGFVGAPAIIWDAGTWTMWYAAGIGGGIARAQSGDGIHWSKSEAPVLASDQVWEDGFVGAPTVMRHNGLYRMYYSGGRMDDTPISPFAGRLIGYADSEDGVAWTKRDTARRSSANSDNVDPVLGPTQWWDGIEPDEDFAGAVTSPSVITVKPAERTITLLYHTGDMLGDPVRHETSIAVAGAFDDYTKFVKAEDGVNPILNEKFALRLYGISEFMAMSESAPSVIRLAYDQYLMAFAQTDPLSETSGGNRGIALAASPPR
ncbi:hypothetical protein K8I61_03370 [bacterium]|nr:hypothetical protein [bacterium]